MSFFFMVTHHVVIFQPKWVFSDSRVDVSSAVPPCVHGLILSHCIIITHITPSITHIHFNSLFLILHFLILSPIGFTTHCRPTF
jgi:hypothetical protein